jgi:hypothetical protein
MSAKLLIAILGTVLGRGQPEPQNYATATRKSSSTNPSHLKPNVSRPVVDDGRFMLNDRQYAAGTSGLQLGNSGVCIDQPTVSNGAAAKRPLTTQRQTVSEVSGSEGARHIGAESRRIRGWTPVVLCRASLDRHYRATKPPSIDMA